MMNSQQGNRDKHSGMQNDMSKQAGQGSGGDINRNSQQGGSQSGSQSGTGGRQSGSQEQLDNSKIGSQQDDAQRSGSNAPGRGNTGH